MLAFSSHLETLLPPGIPSTVVLTPLRRLVPALPGRAAVVGPTDPSLHLRRPSELKTLARERSSGIYRFIVILSALRALPAPADGSLTSLDAGAIARTTLVSAAEGYYLAYLCILCPEPYLFSDVMPPSTRARSCSSGRKTTSASA